MAVKDALIVCALIVFAEFVVKRQRYRILIIATAGIITAASIELYAMATQRWEYASSMPLIPFAHIGVTPTIQLASLGIINYLLMRILKYR